MKNLFFFLSFIFYEFNKINRLNSKNTGLLSRQAFL